MKFLGRKLFHLLGGIGLLCIYFISGRSRALILYAVLVIAVLLVELARLKIAAWNRYVYKHFKSFVRENEQHRLTGTVPYILGVGLSLYAFSPEVAAAAICFLAFGDVAATTVGEAYGRTRIGKKSLEGTAAFLIAAICSGFLLFSLGLEFKVWVMILGALVAAALELLPIPVNDNFIIPVLAGAAMELMLRWTR